MGFFVDEHHQLKVDGKNVAGLYLLGPLCKPALWECTSLREIREQSQTVAQSISSSFKEEVYEPEF